MNPLSSHLADSGVVVSPAQRNAVLRNTYGLLAVSLVPTVLGAWVGVSTGMLNAMGAGLSTILFLAGALPLLIVVVPLVWLGLRWRRRIRAERLAAKRAR